MVSRAVLVGKLRETTEGEAGKIASCDLDVDSNMIIPPHILRTREFQYVNTLRAAS